MWRYQMYTTCRKMIKTTYEKPLLATNVISLSAGGLLFVGDAIQEKLELTKGNEYVASLIDDKKVVVISKSTCPHCRKTKKVLRSYKIKKDCLEILEINNRNDMSQIQIFNWVDEQAGGYTRGKEDTPRMGGCTENYMQQITGERSVPRVFIDGACIGGGDDTVAMHRNGKLIKLLEEAGVLED